MIVRDLFQNVPEERIVARAILEDRCSLQGINVWITKYYAQLVKLKSCKVRKSDMMFYLSVVKDDYRGLIGAEVSGFFYEDIKAGIECYYGIENLNYRLYAALYVPDYTVQRYGEEVVASEALREYGWNGYDDKIKCTDDFRVKVLQALEGMKQEIFLTDHNYFDRCRTQFRRAYEGREVPQWDDAKSAEGEKSNKQNMPHCMLF